MNTLLLSRDTWDLAVNAQGNIAMASDPYSMVQDVASACRLFQNDSYYRPADGIPYFQQVLGHFQPIQVVKSFLVRAATSVPGVTGATAVLSGIKNRQLSGQVQVVIGGSVEVVSI